MCDDDVGQGPLAILEGSGACGDAGFGLLTDENRESFQLEVL